MKNAFFVSLSTLLLLSPLSAAQAKQGQQTPAAPVAPAEPAGSLAVTGTARADNLRVRTTAAAAPAWLEEKITLEVKEVSIPDAIKKILETAKVKESTVDTEVKLPTDFRLSFSIKDVAVRDVLAAVARFGGAVAYVGEMDKKVTITLRKRTVEVAQPMIITTTNGGTTYSVGAQREVNQALAEARRYRDEAAKYVTATGSFSFGGASLPSKTVSLDKRNADVRDSLKSVLKEAGVDYALEDDVPEDVKKSFTFENVPISTALDVICQSAGIGWRTEPSGTTGEGKNKKVKLLVRIGKKYASRRTGSNGDVLYQFDNAAFGPTFRSNFTLPQNTWKKPVSINFSTNGMQELEDFEMFEHFFPMEMVLPTEFPSFEPLAPIFETFPATPVVAPPVPDTHISEL
jgi:hypothetical protein